MPLSKLSVDPELLQAWLDDALTGNLIYHRVRRSLWDDFCELLKTKGDFPIPRALFLSIKSCLTSRSDQMTDDKKLAFDTAVQDLWMSLEEEEEEKEEAKHVGGGKAPPQAPAQED
jgi:hypothetical protein